MIRAKWPTPRSKHYSPTFLKKKQTNKHNTTQHNKTKQNKQSNKQTSALIVLLMFHASALTFFRK